MESIQLRRLRYPGGNAGWIDQIFSAKAAQNGGIVRRAVQDVEREVGRAAFIDAVARCKFHLIECADQFIMIYRPDHLTVHM